MVFNPTTALEAALLARHRKRIELEEADFAVEIARLRDTAVDVITHREAAKDLDVSTRQVRRWIDEGKISATRVKDRIWHIPRSEWIRWREKYERG